MSVDPKILIGRRCFADAQSLLQAAPLQEALPGTWEAGWYDANLSPEVGSFAVVNPADALAPLAGRVIRVSAQERFCFLYVIGAVAGMDWPLAIQRRAFLHLGLLSLPSLDVVVEVVT